ncbi:iron-siderophore ABC transporter substrate-binding protein [Marinomonas rhizomae]|uniref:Iron complex transport system substrate-binding protein n=1 Tax=Marinomonas rhizomae TaxID=491948 RepID=A0A366JA97_9GAMM|nr:ABC transporter substrate-binding protein [Marinomonas rhizomae]RBP83175.1 iron complex transport system substrate-binding protein [Marinomonas rhizomae]RNF72526.1 iron-siderophore ABC transporter substrate-binding protein [Marinomonas rhizomae]
MKMIIIIAFIFTFTTQSWASESSPFPITIQHAFGSSVISQKPKRVATVAWANHEVPLALGIVPVGFAAATFDDDDGDGVLPWVSAKLKELHAKTPVLFDEGDGVDFEAVAATQPDVILAAYSGLSQSDYDTLSMIAPVVAFKDKPWSTNWRSMIRINSAGLSMAKAGDALISSIEAQIAKRVAQYPELKDKSAMFITHLDPTDLSVIRFYSANDARVNFFNDLGLHSPQSVTDVSRDGQYSGESSIEKIDDFNDVDIFVTYGNNKLLTPLTANPLMSKMRAIKNGSIVLLGRNQMATAANPTPLSITWVLDDYLKALAAAARNAK